MVEERSPEKTLKGDRSAAYAARWAAKARCRCRSSNKCEIQLAYVIGVAKPVSVRAESFGTSNLSDSELTAKVNSIFDFTPKSISTELNLLRPIYTAPLQVDISVEHLD